MGRDLGDKHYLILVFISRDLSSPYNYFYITFWNFISFSYGVFWGLILTRYRNYICVFKAIFPSMDATLDQSVERPLCESWVSPYCAKIVNSVLHSRLVLSHRAQIFVCRGEREKGERWGEGREWGKFTLDRGSRRVRIWRFGNTTFGLGWEGGRAISTTRQSFLNLLLPPNFDGKIVKCIFIYCNRVILALF